LNKLVLVIVSQDTKEIVERWQFDVELLDDGGDKENRG
jgi:hypothetical protein